MATSYTLTIRNMVCDRCRFVVRQLLDEAGVVVDDVELGIVHVRTDDPAAMIDAVRPGLTRFGFDIVDDPRSRTTEAIKRLAIDHVRTDHRGTIPPRLSRAITAVLGIPYRQASTIFHDVVGITIERYVILQRVERVKELLQYDDHSMADIADIVGYSSTQYLSRQFRDVTGRTPGAYRQRPDGRQALDHL